MLQLLFYPLMFLVFGAMSLVSSVGPLSLLILLGVIILLVIRKTPKHMWSHIVVGAVGSSIAGVTVLGVFARSATALGIAMAATGFVLIYYLSIFYRKGKHTYSSANRILYLPLMYLIFVLAGSSAMWMHTDGFLRRVEIDTGINPYIPEETYRPTVQAPIWSYAYWTRSFTDSKEAVLVRQHKHARLIKHIGDEKAVGWSKENVLHAFGKPDAIIQREDGELWIYNAWKEQPDWELPVHMKDGKLIKIGD